MEPMGTIGLVLTGGGARGAYQAGAIKAVCEIAAEVGIPRPFSILSGISAGSINAGYLAGNAENFTEAAKGLCGVWENLTTDKIIDVRPLALGKIALQLMWQLFTGRITPKKALSLLDTTPLSKLISNDVACSRIQENIEKSYIKGLVITAVSYTDGYNCNFYQVKDELSPWIRARRVAEKTTIRPEHVLASCSIPLLFPPVQINGHYYGDGSLRNYTPLSPAIKLGANKLLVIPVRRRESSGNGEHDVNALSIGSIVGVLLNGILLDAIDLDYERLSRINRTLSLIPKNAETSLQPIKVCMIRPSEDVSSIAEQEAHSMPKSLRYMISGLGSSKEISSLLSYLLFEKSFTSRLIELGYHDAFSKRLEIIEFLTQP